MQMLSIMFNTRILNLESMDEIENDVSIFLYRYISLPPAPREVSPRFFSGFKEGLRSI